MKLCNLPDDEVLIGLRVWNYQKTNKGTIIDVWIGRHDWLEVLIAWDNSNTASSWWACQLELDIA